MKSSSHLIKKLFLIQHPVFFTPIFTDIIQKLVMRQGVNLWEGCNTIWAAKLHPVKAIWALFWLKTYFSPARVKKRSPLSDYSDRHQYEDNPYPSTSWLGRGGIVG
ncbi:MULTISPECIES: hypothetical protein [unclassified Microcoleus]|uniref:hypothetical protein n=1 Tax=unclassified Microcoleus TaxID=2642155 RepID=UPI002FD69253